jgi:hypothetical protein
VFIAPARAEESNPTSQRNSRLYENQKNHTIVTVTEGLSPWAKAEQASAKSNAVRKGNMITTTCESSSDSMRPNPGEWPWPEEKPRNSLDLERGGHGKEPSFAIFTSTTITQTVSEQGSI